VSASRITHHASRLGLWVAVALLLILFAQVAFTAARTSLTIDEGLHITSGYSILRTGDYRLVEEHPPLVKMLAALPLLLVDDLPDVQTLPGWQSDVSVLDSVRLVRAAQALIYAYRPIDRLVFAARMPVALLTVLLGTLVLRWAADLAGWRGGLLALFLLSFDPNILAHGSVAGTDLGAACFIVLAMFTFWRFMRRPALGRMILAGVALGLAQAVKLTGLLLLPLQVLIVIWLFICEKRKTLVAQLAALLAFAAITLWAVYRFESGCVSGVPFPVPAASHAIPWLRLQQHISGGHAAFLMGQVSHTGWWYYFPVTFALKTPLPTLILLAASLMLAVGKRHMAKAGWALGLFPLVYFASSMANPLNIGYRHLLPILPFVFVFIGVQIATPQKNGGQAPKSQIPNLKSPRHLVILLLAWNAVGTVRMFPHYLAYFNQAAGGPENGWRYLADSNTDWGQALKELAAYQRTHDIERVKLSMFTFIDPAIYGVRYEPLTPMKGNTPAVFPSRFNPPPGDYVISATTLDGIPLADPEMFDWFRQREPDARIGHVMFLYRVKPGEPRAWVAQCARPVTPLPPSQIAEGFGRSDLRLAYFDCAQSWLYPTGGQSPGWFVLAHEASIGSPRWLSTSRLSYEQKRAGFSPPFRIYEDDGRIAWPIGGRVRVAPSDMPLAEASNQTAVELPVSFEGGLTLIGYRLDRSTLKSGETAYLETVWRVDSVPDRLLSIMAHTLGADGRAIAVGDGLGVPIESWQPGDVFIQRHLFALPKDTPPGMYWVQTGVYWLDDGQRWSVRDARATGDRGLLALLEVH